MELPLCRDAVPSPLPAAQDDPCDLAGQGLGVALPDGLHHGVRPDGVDLDPFQKHRELPVLPDPVQRRCDHDRTAMALLLFQDPPVDIVGDG